MESPGILIGAILVLGAVYVVLPRLVWTFRHYRGLKTLRCPATEKKAGIAIDARHAATSAFFSEPELRVKQCSNWPEHAFCNEECLREPANQPALYANSPPYVVCDGR